MRRRLDCLATCQGHAAAEIGNVRVLLLDLREELIGLLVFAYVGLFAQTPRQAEARLASRFGMRVFLDDAAEQLFGIG